MRACSLICFGRRSHAPSIVRVRRGALDECGGHSSSQGQFIDRCPVFRRVASWTQAGALRFPGDPSRAFAVLHDPGRAYKTSPVSGLASAALGSSRPKASAGTQSRGFPHGFGICRLRFTSCVAAAHARLASGWRAAPLPGGSRTPWVASKGFRLHSSSLPGLSLTQTGYEVMQ